MAAYYRNNLGEFVKEPERSIWEHLTRANTNEFASLGSMQAHAWREQIALGAAR